MFEIFDIDGTLTKPGYDLWHLTTRSLVSEVEQFERAVIAWKTAMQSGACPVAESYKMMQVGLELIPAWVTAELVRETAKKEALWVLANQAFFVEAIQYIQQAIAAGVTPIFATANYVEGAISFVAALVEQGFLAASEAKKIVLSGTDIDWATRDIRHFNMAEKKIEGICQQLQLSRSELTQKVLRSFGDDPLGNDRGILQIADIGYVIQNPKNAWIELPANQFHTTWAEIRKLRQVGDRLQSLLP